MTTSSPRTLSSTQLISYSSCATARRCSRSAAVFLVVPDKRYSFDRFRPQSTVGDVLQAHHADNDFHTLGALVDHQIYACARENALAWASGDARPLRLQFPDLAGVPEAVRDGLEQREYRDTHRWQLTPSSFRLLINDLARLGYHGLGVVASAPIPRGSSSS